LRDQPEARLFQKAGLFVIHTVMKRIQKPGIQGRCRALTKELLNQECRVSNQFRVLITDRAWPDLDIERGILSTVGAEIIDSPSGDEDTLVELARDADAIGTCWAKVTAAVIQAAPRCRVIARFGIGLDNIDVQTATRRRIPVTYVPDYCVNEVADHALALILSLARKIAFFHLRTKQGEYKLQAGPTLRRIAAQRLGLVGFGRIAQNLYAKAKAIGFDVSAYSLSGDDRGTGCRMVGFDELVAESDCISLHLPLSERSRHLFGMREFERMKETAYVINTSRGAILDQDALWDAIDAGQIAGAALDVFDPEPPDLSLPLYRDERVIVTPHTGFLSAESLVELRRRAATQIAQSLQGSRPANVVNPAVYGEASQPVCD
jgi:D-3-phosphoglycerate dehydrogenase